LLARGLNKKLFAVLIDPAKTMESLPAELTGAWQVVNLVAGHDHQLFAAKMPGSHEERHVHFSQSGLLRLRRGLEKAGLDARYFAWPPESEPDRSPYRGLKPLEAPDAGVYFGRDAPIVEAIDMLRGMRAGAPPRIFVILGASGSGKSSFLRAGLLPRLKRDDAQFIPLPVIRPQPAAMTGETGLVNALTAILPAESRADLRAAAKGGADSLRRLLTKLVQAAVAARVAGDETERPPTIMIAIDQAEELFREEAREESETLLSLLADLACGNQPAVIVIFAIRSDSYDALQRATALQGHRQAALPLLPMPHGAFAEVIVGPTRRVEAAGGKLKIEPALTQRLLVDIETGAGDALPLLAFTLEQLYLDYRPTTTLKLSNYQKFGGLKGAIDAAVQRALLRADSDPRIPKNGETRLQLIRSGLIPWLASIDPDTKTARRNIARRSDIPSEAAPLLDLLVEERLLSADTRLTRDPNTAEEIRESTIEPTHEALLRQWDKLQGWLNDDFEALLVLGEVHRAAAEWERQRGKEEYLWPEKRVVQACRVVDRLRPPLNQTEKRFLLLLDANDLLQELGNPFTPHQRRAAIGDRLADIGDSRAGVGWRDGTVDLLWCEVPGANIVLDDGAGTYSVKPFRMAKYPVTLAQYRRFLEEQDGYANPAWWEQLVHAEFPEPTPQAANRPAVNVSWYDAVAFCRWLSARIGYEVRLPAEWEWETAATGGDPSHQYAWGAEWDPQFANTEESGLNRSTAVGMYPHAASGTGILDLCGNVWEWCFNSYEALGASAQAEDQARVVRGGSWLWNHDSARVRRRDRDKPNYRSWNHGFRLACSID
jgi:formylglycine-generating enzyme required for sulfatase activity